MKMRILFSRDNKYLYSVISVLVLLFYFLPFFMSNPHVLIHDNLDSNLVWTKVLAESGKIFKGSDASLPFFLNGLPRDCFGSEFNLLLWLVYFFGSYTAYVISQILMRVIAFFGMFLLLKNHIVKEKNNDIVIFGVALTFALLPFYPPGGLTVAGQPLALYSFLNFRENKHSLKDWIILIFIPFYSSLVLGFFFFLVAVSLLWLYDLWRLKKINYVFLSAIALMASVYVIVEYRLFYSMLFDNEFVSHRVEFFSNIGLIESIKNTKDVLINGQYHAASIHRNFILLALLMSISFILVKGLESRLLFTILFIIAITSGIYGFWDWKGLTGLINTIGILSAFQFSRFHFLQPLLWFIVFALSLKLLQEQMQKYGRYVVMGFILCQIGILFYHHDAVQERDNPSYKEFYATDLFAKIEKYIGKEKQSYRIINVGLHPAISQYNGFYTLDGYYYNYPLAYKHEFRKVIAAELEKDKSIKDYFDNWGSRCYAFSAELGRNYIEKNHPMIQHLDFDYDKLKQMRGEFIISSAKIDTLNNNSLKLCSIFSNEKSYWTIYLYKIK